MQTRTDQARQYLASLSPRRKACAEIGVGYEWACKFINNPDRKVVSEMVDKVLAHRDASIKRNGRAA